MVNHYILGGYESQTPWWPTFDQDPNQILNLWDWFWHVNARSVGDDYNLRNLEFELFWLLVATPDTINMQQSD